MDKIYFETLGCSKNQVDSEKMIFLLEKEGYDLTDKPEEAEYIIINTCCFIESAKKEAIETILEFNKYKTSGVCKKLIVAGCLAQYYSKDLLKGLKEVDTIFGVGDISQIVNVIKKNDRLIIPEFKQNEIIKRKFLNYPGFSYLKISEGCSNFCNYCIIPKIRGTLHSRQIDDILKEVEFLKSNNIKEINIIAQDTANYGVDLYGKRMLGDLILTIDRTLDSESWIRILYMHPDHMDKELLNILAKAKYLIPYFDIPFQSGSGNILKSMNRKGDIKKFFDLLNDIRNTFENPVIRSTFITGYPGETDRDFNDTVNFIKSAKLDWVGGFTYSKEEGTLAAEMKKQVKESVKKKRLNEIYNLSHEITVERLKRFINTTNIFLIEERVENEDLYIGRFWAQAPEVDGLTVIQGKDLRAGEFIKAKIIKLNEKDFYATT